MWSIVAAIALLPVSLCHPADPGSGNPLGAKPVDRILPRAAPKDFGTFKVKCAGSESACNNACYYINCVAKNDKDANKITFIGPNGNNGEADRNRMESGCQTPNGSVCGNYPFSQKFIDDQSKATSYSCDEWPPAAAQQEVFDKKATKNSLRCMPHSENASLGAKLGNFINNRGTFPGRPAGAMARDDYFRVTFDTAGADQTKLKFCLGQGAAKCTNDGYQFALTEKKTKNGKISAPFDGKGTDSHYALQKTDFKDLFQCSIELVRANNDDFGVELLNWENKDVTQTKSCTISGATGTCQLKGLPNTLTIEKHGGRSSKVGFTYAAAGNANYFRWDSESTGNGRGPATDSGHPLQFCKFTQSQTAVKTECWFPCYKTASGK
jgi:hypothetical protein